MKKLIKEMALVGITTGAFLIGAPIETAYAKDQAATKTECKTTYNNNSIVHTCKFKKDGVAFEYQLNDVLDLKKLDSRGMLDVLYTAGTICFIDIDVEQSNPWRYQMFIDRDCDEKVDVYQSERVFGYREGNEEAFEEFDKTFKRTRDNILENLAK